MAEQKKKRKGKCGCVLSPEELAGMASTLAISLSRGKSDNEVRSIINLLSLTTNTLSTMLNQRQCSEPDLVIPLD